MKMICFDLDGTLIDSRKDIVSAANKVLSYHNLDEVNLSDGLKHVGKGAKHLLLKLLPTSLHDSIENSLKLFLDFYDANPVENTLVYEGVHGFFSDHTEMKMTIVTNKHETLAIKILTQLGLVQHFKRIIGGDTYVDMKPNPMALNEMMNDWGLQKSEVLMVGDTNVDIQFGINAGVKTCRFHSGFGALSHEPLLASDFEIDSISELASFL